MCYHPTGDLEKEVLFKYRNTVLNKEHRILHKTHVIIQILELMLSLRTYRGRYGDSSAQSFLTLLSGLSPHLHQDTLGVTLSKL